MGYFADVVRPKSCCSCFDLQQGCMIIGMYSALQIIVEFSLAIAGHSSGPAWAGSTVWIVVWCIVAIVVAAASCLLIAGVAKGKPAFMVPYVNIAICSLVFDLLALWVLWSMGSIVVSSSLTAVVLASSIAAAAAASAGAATGTDADDGEAAEKTVVGVFGVLTGVGAFVIVWVAVRVHMILVVVAYRDQLNKDGGDAKNAVEVVGADRGGRQLASFDETA